MIRSCLAGPLPTLGRCRVETLGAARQRVEAEVPIATAECLDSTRPPALFGADERKQGGGTGLVVGVPDDDMLSRQSAAMGSHLTLP